MSEALAEIVEPTDEAQPAPDTQPEAAPAPETTDGAPTDAEGAEASAAPEGVAAEAQAEAAQAAQEAWEAFQIRAFGQPYTIEGAEFDAQRRMLRFADEKAFNRTRGLLSQAREWETKGRPELVALRKQVQQLQAGPPPAEVADARRMMEQLQQVMAIGDDESFLSAMLHFRSAWPVLQAEAKAAYLQQQLEAATRPPEPDVDVVQQQAYQGAETLAEEILGNQPWATPDVSERLTAFLQSPAVLNQFVFRATRDIPDMGLRAGQYVADWDKARELAEAHIDPYRRAHELIVQQTAKVQATAAQTTKIAAQNAAATAGIPRTTPAPARPAPRAPSAPTPAEPMTPAQQRQALMAKLERDRSEMLRAR